MPSLPASTTWPPMTATGGADGCSASSTTAGDEVLDLLSRAAARYAAENALNTMAFPSLGRMQHDIVTITAGLLGADRRPTLRAAPRGYLTSGGTESLLQATKTARDWGAPSAG